MLRKFGLAAFTLAAFALVGTLVIAADEKKKDDKKDKDEVPSIKDCMAFQKKDGLPSQIEKAAKADKWDDAQKAAADLSKLGEALGKNAPTKNADKKEDWEKITKAFADRTGAVEKAAKAKKADDVSDAVKALLDKKTCGACHGTFKK
jgi:hypothetical protein